MMDSFSFGSMSNKRKVCIVPPLHVTMIAWSFSSELIDFDDVKSCKTQNRIEVYQCLFSGYCIVYQSFLPPTCNPILLDTNATSKSYQVDMFQHNQPKFCPWKHCIININILHFQMMNIENFPKIRSLSLYLPTVLNLD